MAQSFLLHKIHEIDTTFAGNGGKRNDGMAETKCVGFIESIPLIETLWRAFTNHPYGRCKLVGSGLKVIQNNTQDPDLIKGAVLLTYCFPIRCSKYFMFWSQSVVLSDPPQLSLKYKLSNTDPSPSTFATTLQLPTSNTPLTSDPTMPLVPKAAYLMWTMTVSTMLTRWWGPWRKHQRQTSHHPCPHVRDKWRKTRDLILYPSLRGFIRLKWRF